LCGRTFGKVAMSRHLTACLAKQAAAADTPSTGVKLFHLLVQGTYLSHYWLHLEMPDTATFGDLDAFLRRTWLECCGHLSAFTRKTGRGAPRGGGDEVPMEAQLGQVLRPGMELLHEYDFGSTTTLALKVIGTREGTVGNEHEVRLLARNDPPLLPCGNCGQPATQIDMENSYDPSGWLCDQCAEDAGLAEEMMLPVVDSPRTGVCGYTG